LEASFFCDCGKAAAKESFRATETHNTPKLTISAFEVVFINYPSYI
jgi:hypothetical protein